MHNHAENYEITFKKPIYFAYCNLQQPQWVTFSNNRRYRYNANNYLCPSEFTWLIKS